jgi:hypothetical protein
MSFEDIDGEIIIDMDSNSFTIERDGKVQAYDLDVEAEWFQRIYDSAEIPIYELDVEGEYEVYGQ